ncbi:MAG: BamA/TamA family outer membrane protein [Candidatus Latescibacteria bacterium]|nr:BamA/TamA family outer membrane protein [Candidatus Latescibacterota bacterium]
MDVSIRTPHSVIRTLSKTAFILCVLITIQAAHAASPLRQTAPADSAVRHAQIAPHDLEALINRDGTTVRLGDVSIGRGTAVAGPLVILHGNLYVSGTVDGDLFVINGSASLQGGSVVTGDVKVIGGQIYASRRATVQGQRVVYAGEYTVSRTKTGSLRLSPVQPSGVEWTIRPSGWRFSRVRGHEVDLTLRVVPLKETGRPSLTGTITVPTEPNDHGFLGFKAGVVEPFFVRHPLRLGIEGYKMTDTNDRWQVPPLHNSLAAFGTKNDFYNYFLRSGFTAYAEQRVGQHAMVRMEYRHDTFRTLAVRSPFTLFGGNRAFRANPDIDEGAIHGLVWRARYDTRPSDVPPDNAWSFDAELERAEKGLGGDFRFTRFDVTISRYNAWRGHHLNVRAKLAASGAPLPLQRSYVLGAAGGLRGFGDFEYAGDRLLVFNAEYRLPVTTLRRQQFVSWKVELIPFFDAGTAFFSAASGRNVLTHPALRSRVSPHLGLPLPDGFSDLRSDAGAGVALSSRLLYASVFIAQNLHDADVGPRVVVRLYREL